MCNPSFSLNSIILLFDCYTSTLLKYAYHCQMSATVSWTDDRGVESRSSQCSSQMLRLRALLPPPAKLIHRSQQQQQQPAGLQHSSPHKNHRGLFFILNFHKTFPLVSRSDSSLPADFRSDPFSWRASQVTPTETPTSSWTNHVSSLWSFLYRSPMSFRMIPTKCLLSALTTDRLSRQRGLGDRNSFGLPERYLGPEDSHTNKTRRDDTEQEKDPAETSHNSLFVLRSRPPRADLSVPHDSTTEGPPGFALRVCLTPHSFSYSPACVRTKVTSASYCQCWSLQLWRRWRIHVVAHRNSFRTNVSDSSTLDEDIELWPLHEHHHSEEPHSQHCCRTLLIIWVPLAMF